MNHLYTEDFSSTDAMGLLKKEGIGDGKNIYAFSVSSYGVLYWRDKKEEVPRAKAILQAQKAVNPQTGENAMPVVGSGPQRHEKWSRGGLRTRRTLPHLLHRYRSGAIDDLARSHYSGKNGWQIPVYNGHVPNVGVKAPACMRHGAFIMAGMALSTHFPLSRQFCPGRQAHGILQNTIRIADLWRNRSFPRRPATAEHDRGPRPERRSI